MLTFKAQLDIIGINPFVFVPQHILQALFNAAGKDKGNIPVCGLVNGRPFDQTLLRYKGEWRLYINTVMLPNSPKRIGELLDVSVEFDKRDRTLHPHPDLLAALAQNKDALERFEALSPSARKEIIRYIAALKTPESRKRNINWAVGFLLGKNDFAGRNMNNRH